MKIPLRFQITEFDCGTVALQNAISYLYDRENVPAELVRAVSIYTVNCYDERGYLAEHGDVKDITNNMTTWTNDFVNKFNFGLSCRRLLGESITMDELKKCVENRGCILMKTHREGIEHFVIITDITDEYVYVWDSYYLGETYYDKERKISIVFNKPFHYNREVDLDRFLDTSNKDLALGSISERECLLFNRTF